MNSQKPKILTLVTYYLPGYKSGGPLRTISNLVERLGDDFEFYILTSDRDATDTEPYPNIQVGQWQSVGKAKVRYVPPTTFRRPLELSRYFRDFNYDIVYLNSYFATQSVMYLVLRFLKLVPKVPVILAPRGEFSPGALKLKLLKKKLFMFYSKLFKMHKNILWQASSEDESKNIKMHYKGATILVAPDLTPVNYDLAVARPVKHPGSAKLVFLSRITPMKNLFFALQLLAQIDHPLSLDIYGPIRDENYWQECQTMIAQMPNHIEITYKGSLLHEEVVPTLSQYHLFFLPTLGENFGHVVIEAMYAGCLVLISDQTPWQSLQNFEIGWDLPLENTEDFKKRIGEVIDMDQSEFTRRSEKAHTFAQDNMLSEEILEANRVLLRSAVDRIPSK